MTEYASGELGEKIKAVICEWSKRVEEGSEPGNYLESADIYERLVSEGVEVPDHAMSEILVELASGGQIKLTMDSQRSTEPRKYGSMTIHKVPTFSIARYPLCTEVRLRRILGCPQGPGPTRAPLTHKTRPIEPVL